MCGTLLLNVLNPGAGGGAISCNCRIPVPFIGLLAGSCVPPLLSLAVDNVEDGVVVDADLGTDMRL